MRKWACLTVSESVNTSLIELIAFYPRLCLTTYNDSRIKPIWQKQPTISDRKNLERLANLHTEKSTNA